jgi:diacylglycerol kinase family enzyme
LGRLKSLLEAVSSDFLRGIVVQTTLIYNPHAGIRSNLTPDKILEALGQAGYDPNYSPTSTEEDLDGALAKAKDLVVVAGGDGSIRAVATHLLGRDVRIAPLPLGTANNVARLLGLTGKPLEIIAGLADPVERDMDMGLMITPRGPTYFLEATGMGMFADLLKNYKPEEGKSIPRGIQTLLETLNDYQPKFFHVNVDGEDVSGSYFLVEVMNTPTVGFHFMLAPDAKPDDGLFDLVLIHANERENYLKFMTGVLTGTVERLPAVSMQRGQRLEIAWRGFPVHLDERVMAGLDGAEEDDYHPQTDESNPLDVSKPYLSVELLPRAVHFMVPRATTIPREGE